MARALLGNHDDERTTMETGGKKRGGARKHGRELRRPKWRRHPQRRKDKELSAKAGRRKEIAGRPNPGRDKLKRLQEQERYQRDRFFAWWLRKNDPALASAMQKGQK